MLNNPVEKQLKKGWNSFVNATRNNLGQSVVRNVVATPTVEQLERSKLRQIRRDVAQEKVKAAQVQLAQNPGDPNLQEKLRLAKQERVDVFASEWLENAGAVSGDYIGDGTRNLWWLINAPQAITGLIGRQIAKSEGFGPLGAAVAGTGLTLGMELATGNIDVSNLDEAGRPRGYSVLFPKESERINPETGELEVVLDRTKSNNPAAELAARYFLNRTGRILPEEEFLKERPDVTPEEYARFAAAKRDNTFFGIEDMPLQTSVPLGAIGGTVLANSAGRNRLAGALLGGIAAPLAKEVVVDVPTSLGILRGSTETPDDPVGEIEFLGYRIPAKAIAATALMGAGLKLGSRAWRNRSLTDTPMQIGLDFNDATRFNKTPVGPPGGNIPRSHVKVFNELDLDALENWLDNTPGDYQVSKAGNKYYVYKNEMSPRERWVRENEAPF